MHPAIPTEILDLCGVLPARARIRESLISELVAGDPEEDGPSPSTVPRTSSLTPVQHQEEPEIGIKTWKSTRPIRFLKGLSAKTLKKEEIVSSSSSSSEEEGTIDQTGELLTALCHIAELPTLPPLTISYIAWIVSQLTFPAPAPTASEECLESIETALMVSRTSVDEELRGIWSDVLLPLFHQQWTLILANSREPKLILSSSILLDCIYSQKASELGSTVYNNHGSVSSQQLAVRLRLPYSAQCALHILYKVQRLIALVQLRQVNLKISLSQNPVFSVWSMVMWKMSLDSLRSVCSP